MGKEKMDNSTGKPNKSSNGKPSNGKPSNGKPNQSSKAKAKGKPWDSKCTGMKIPGKFW